MDHAEVGFEGALIHCFVTMRADSFVPLTSAEGGSIAGHAPFISLRRDIRVRIGGIADHSHSFHCIGDKVDCGFLL